MLEQIVTDSGAQTASQIEALREQARIPVRGQDAMNPFEFVLAVLILVFAFTIIRHKMGIPVRSMRQMRGDPPDDAENARLRQQVSQLQQRINVLERIVTDRGVETAAQIEALRDRDAIQDEDKVQ